ncbi:TlpA family protein disulfide reductase [Ornithinicoccus halotolerans]|uniref:TlpA family protein disulfide reductase n=1 Tax=Ornithinicoccus halotolerans TaxID=1748220 RepID=UPI0012955571|nr:MauE/DoxX family redox-associated membrane protein [Ornithinicoccus halotolerans]
MQPLPEAVVAGYLLVAAVLGVAGVGTLARPGLAAAGAATLGLPRALTGVRAARAHGGLELLLAAALLLPAPVVRWPALAVLLLLGCYLGMVALAVARGGEGDCYCFGAFGSSRLGGRTVARNVLLLAVALLVTLDAWRGGSVPAHLAAAGGRAGWWLVAVAVSVLVALLLRGGSEATTSRGAVERAGAWVGGTVPDATVELEAAPRSLRELAAERPRLLLFLSPSCGPCLHLSDRLEELRERLPGTGVHVVTPLGTERLTAEQRSWRAGLLVDPGRTASDALGVREPPAAVLLAGEQVVAGPVHGPEAVLRLVDDAEAGRLAGH